MSDAGTCCSYASGLDAFHADITATTCVECGQHCHMEYVFDANDEKVPLLANWRCRDCHAKRRRVRIPRST